MLEVKQENKVCKNMDKSSGMGILQMARTIGNQAAWNQLGRSDATGIPDRMKERFEADSKLSFDDVKVHYNSEKPRQIGALAYTQGSQIYIGPGNDNALPHELGHVIQQKQGRVTTGERFGSHIINEDETLEREADSYARNLG